MSRGKSWNEASVVVVGAIAAQQAEFDGFNADVHKLRPNWSVDHLTTTLTMQATLEPADPHDLEDDDMMDPTVPSHLPSKKHVS